MTEPIFDDRIVVEAGSPEYAAIAAALNAGDHLVLDVRLNRTEKVFESGDKVQVPFDDGWGPAVVDHAGETFVTVRYGPRNRPDDLKFRTNLEKASVRTDNLRTIPAAVRVVR
jgi:hypothetical protein